MKKELTLASLFDGSGGFPQAAIINGIRPLWSSEIEPFPALVTYKRLPDVPNLGDVRKIDGSKVPPVDVITFGSPCQDLSSSGRRAGIIEGERSSLFFEAIRIIREMREATGGRFPRFALWENVPGALSSNGGNDFLEVLRSFVSLWGDNDENIKFNRYNGGGRRGLRPSGILRGRRSSLAWRVLNAQFFGVPQRRRRVFLVCDFGGRSAEKLLFDEREEPFGARTVFSKWQAFAGRVPRGGPEASRIAEDAETVPPFAVLQQYFDFIPSGEISPMIRRSNSTAIRVFWKGRLRNLTPKEWCSLQGFPRDYCEGLAIEEPTEKEVETFGRYFETVGRKKTEKEIRRWLRAPYSAGAEFQLWGNGVALPVVVFVLSQLVEYLKEEEKEMEFKYEVRRAEERPEKPEVFSQLVLTIEEKDMTEEVRAALNSLEDALFRALAFTKKKEVEKEVPPEEEKMTPPLTQAITEAAALAVAGSIKEGEKE